MSEQCPECGQTFELNSKLAKLELGVTWHHAAIAKSKEFLLRHRLSSDSYWTTGELWKW